MTKYIDADIFVTHCCNSCIKNGVRCCPTVDSCDYIEDLQAFLVDAPAAADRLESQEQTIAALTARAEQAEAREKAAIADMKLIADNVRETHCDDTCCLCGLSMDDRGGIKDE